MLWFGGVRLHPDYIPTTWDDLKNLSLEMDSLMFIILVAQLKITTFKTRHRHGKKYYDDLQTTLLHSFLEESEDDFMDRFWGLLNRDIQEILIHEECYPMDHLFHLACKAEQEIKRRVGHKENKRTVHIPRVDMIVPSWPTRHFISCSALQAR